MLLRGLAKDYFGFGSRMQLFLAELLMKFSNLRHEIPLFFIITH